jgi:Nucleoside-diphosphate-sugar epimerases
VKVFVTGATGFIGSHLMRVLLAAGHDVLILTRPDGNPWRIRDILHQVSIVQGTMQEIQNVQEQLRIWQPQACVHLAWYAEPGKYLNSKENLASLQDGLKLLQILASCGCEQFVGAGTCAEYEMKSEVLLETDRTKPETLYAATKSSFQVLGEQLAAQAGLRFAWGRVFHLYGSSEDTRRLIPATILSLQKGHIFSASLGEQIRDYLHVTDVASAFAAMVEQRAVGIYNICSSEPVTIRFILETVGGLMGQPELIKHGVLPYREWEPMFLCGNNDRLKTMGWVPQVELRSGLKATINWWEQALKTNDRLIAS